MYPSLSGQPLDWPAVKQGSDSEFVGVPAPTDEAVRAVLHKIITRMMKLLTRQGVLLEEQG